MKMIVINGYYRAVLLLFALITTLGCSPESTIEPEQHWSSLQDDFDLIDGIFASHNPQPEDLRYSLTEVAEKISKTGEWKPVTLKEVGIGKYEATALTEDNREFRMEVRQTSNGIYWRWKNADGSSGGSAMNTW